MGLFTKLFGTYSERELKRVRPIADQVLRLEDKYKAMTDEQLQGMTAEFKQRLAAGTTTLDTLLPEAFG